MRYRFYTADVFTRHIFGGNQLAVFPQAQGLDARLMQALAAEFNFSETVYVFPPMAPQHTRHLRIFTPGMELPFAGHPTLGAAFVLAAIGEIPLAGEVTEVIFEEGVGPVKVSINAENGRPVFSELSASKLPEYGPPPPPIRELAVMLSLDPDELLAGEYVPEAVSCGVPFLYIPLRNLESIRRARLVREQWERLLSSFWAPHVYLLTFETEGGEAGIHARMFAPAMGIAEDPATGAAATALAGYLGRREPASGHLQWTVEQGIEMGRPSLLEVQAEKEAGEIRAIRVGGASVMVAEGTINVPDPT